MFLPMHVMHDLDDVRDSHADGAIELSKKRHRCPSWGQWRPRQLYVYIYIHIYVCVYIYIYIHISLHFIYFMHEICVSLTIHNIQSGNHRDYYRTRPWNGTVQPLPATRAKDWHHEPKHQQPFTTANNSTIIKQTTWFPKSEGSGRPVTRGLPVLTDTITT